MRVAVTGATGFIGAAVTGPLVRRGDVVVPVDLAGDEPCDITDTAALTDRLRGADAVIHLAAVADFVDCDDDPEHAQHVNAGGTLGVLAALERDSAGETYNLVGAELVTVNDVVAAVDGLVGDVSVVRLPARVGEVTMPMISAAKAVDELGWVPRTPPTEGLARQSAVLTQPA
jgi:nucleoside-diphosphate-sugar epimerase